MIDGKSEKVFLQEEIRTKLFPTLRYTLRVSGNDFVAFRCVEMLRFPDLLRIHSPLFCGLSFVSEMLPKWVCQLNTIIITVTNLN